MISDSRYELETRTTRNKTLLTTLNILTTTTYKCMHTVYQGKESWRRIRSYSIVCSSTDQQPGQIISLVLTCPS